MGFPDLEIAFPDREMGFPDLEITFPDREMGFPDLETLLSGSFERKNQ
jgi:hypothetical protein